jgi:16S rRNA processing protein RimM
MTRSLSIGWVVRPHGVHGALRARIELDDIGVLSAGTKLLVGETYRELLSLGLAPGGPPFYLIRLRGVEGREAAQDLKGKTLAIGRSELPPLDEDNPMLEDLVGLVASDADGTSLGAIERVSLVAGQPMAHIDGAMIPLNGPFVTEIDFGAGTITFDLPPGLLELQR